jgi:RecA-family ATPase
MNTDYVGDALERARKKGAGTPVDEEVPFDAPPDDGWQPLGDPPAQPVPNLLKHILLRPAEWEGKPVPPRRWFAKNRIPIGEVTGLGGDGGMGKTQIALQACVQSATAAPDWLGAALDEVGPAIFFSAEEPAKEIHYRLEQIRQHRNISYADMQRVHPICTIEHPEIDPTFAGLVKRTNKVETTRTFGWFKEIVLDLKPKLIAIEAASDIFDVDEVVRNQARACVRLLQGLAMKADAAALLLYHPSLSGMASGRGTAGSTQWNNAMRSRLYFRNLSGKDDDSSSNKPKVLEVMKANRGPTGEKVVLEWTNGVFTTPSSMTTVEKAAHEQHADTAFLNALRRLIGQNQDVHPSKTSTYSAVKLMKGMPEIAGIKHDDLKAAQQRLLDNGKIRIEDYGPKSKARKRLTVV